MKAKTEQKARALALVAGGTSRKQAARKVGVSTSSVSVWVESGVAPVTHRHRPSNLRYCEACCGLPHRRPQTGPCVCGEGFAPEQVAHPLPTLSSSAGWGLDVGEEDES